MHNRILKKGHQDGRAQLGPVQCERRPANEKHETQAAAGFTQLVVMIDWMRVFRVVIEAADCVREACNLNEGTGEHEPIGRNVGPASTFASRANDKLAQLRSRRRRRRTTEQQSAACLSFGNYQKFIQTQFVFSRDADAGWLVQIGIDELVGRATLAGAKTAGQVDCFVASRMRAKSLPKSAAA